MNTVRGKTGSGEAVLRFRSGIIRTGLEALYFSGAHRILRAFCEGVGAILMLHHVRPARRDGFQPNRLLEITPEFLNQAIRRLRASGIEFISLDEMHRRLIDGDFRRRFACVTFDDGYRDNKTWAYPILKENRIPFAIYVPTSFPDRLGKIWWLALEAVVARNASIAMVIEGQNRRFVCESDADKNDLFQALYWWLRSLPSEEELLAVVQDLSRRYGVDWTAICEQLCLTWDELLALAADPLVTIGAHTVNHVMLSKASDEVVRSELRMGRAVLESVLGAAPRHLAYPYGDVTTAGPREFAIAAELGFKTAVTTRPGMLFPEHRDHLTALPRISLNGEYQRARYVDVLMSGAGTAVWNGFKRLNVA
jgi:peptidoglycan/xylan/chitin deacetylase (PgdA/CDA1 family)